MQINTFTQDLPLSNISSFFRFSLFGKVAFTNHNFSITAFLCAPFVYLMSSKCEITVVKSRKCFYFIHVLVKYTNLEKRNHIYGWLWSILFLSAITCWASNDFFFSSRRYNVFFSTFPIVFNILNHIHSLK